MNVELGTVTVTLPDMNIAAPLPFCAMFPSKVQLIISTKPPIVAELALLAQIPPPFCTVLFLNIVFSIVVIAELE